MRFTVRLFLLLSLSCLVPARAQTSAPPAIALSSPLDYQVFQRQTRSQGTIVIETSLETAARGALTNLDRLEARLSGEGLPGAWQPLPFDNRVRKFRGELRAPAGGWYRLEVRLIGNGTNVAEAAVEHVGVGEVFVIAGQSNSANHGEERQEAKNPLVVAFGNGRWQPSKDPQPGASGSGGSFLPAFGDAMAERFKVPVGLVPIGVGSTSVREWLPKNEAMAAPPPTGRNTLLVGSNAWVSLGVLFDTLADRERLLGPGGFRAVLWHQGESDTDRVADRKITPALYRQYLQRVIEASRTAGGWNVPWFVAQVTYHSPEDQSTPEIRAAQKALVTDHVALAGPDTDQLGPEFREKNGRGIHFNARGLQRHGELWVDCVAPWLADGLAGSRW